MAEPGASRLLCKHCNSTAPGSGRCQDPGIPSPSQERRTPSSSSRRDRHNLPISPPTRTNLSQGTAPRRPAPKVAAPCSAANVLTGRQGLSPLPGPVKSRNRSCLAPGFERYELELARDQESLPVPLPTSLSKPWLHKVSPGPDFMPFSPPPPDPNSDRPRRTRLERPASDPTSLRPRPPRPHRPQHYQLIHPKDRPTPSRYAPKRPPATYLLYPLHPTSPALQSGERGC